MPDFLPISLQDQLHGCQPEMREPKKLTGASTSDELLSRALEHGLNAK
jgi:hypothetical protein